MYNINYCFIPYLSTSCNQMFRYISIILQSTEKLCLLAEFHLHIKNNPHHPFICRNYHSTYFSYELDYHEWSILVSDTVFVFLQLSLFTQHVLKAKPCFKWHYVFFVYSMNNTLLCLYATLCFSFSPVCRHTGYFYLLTTVNNGPMNMHM